MTVAEEHPADPPASRAAWPALDPPIDPHRLPRSVLPRRYDLTMSIDVDGGGFSGTAVVEVDVVEATQHIVCNSLDLQIDEVVVEAEGSRLEVVDVRTDPGSERLAARLDQPLPVGPATVTFRFSGTFGDQLVGLYRSTFETDDGDTATLAVTQFEAPHARRAFPCWDEPDFKAVFAVTLEHDDRFFSTSNGREAERTALGDGRVQVRFSETIPMSTYLVAFVVGPLVATDPVEVRGTPVRVVCRPGREHLAGEALDVAAHCVAWFEDYYGIPYPGDSLDLVAVPDFAFGAMENLGCVTFREILLLADPEAVTRAERERAALVIAHELAHMWFGDLVTMDWWTGIWLNEAFATFMELACVDAYRPDWDVWSTFGLSRAEAFTVDSLASTRPIEFEVRTPDDAEAMFDILTYEKGCGVLRMMEQYLGPDVFRDGVRAYLRTHALGNTVTSDLWDALEDASGEPVRRVMEQWILQGGHPVIEVASASGGLRLDQRRMSFEGGDEAEPRSWPTPVVLRDSDGEVHHLLLEPIGATVDVPAHGAVNANAGAVGFYRTRYDARLSQRLWASIGDLSPVEQFSALDDTWALLLAGLAGPLDLVAGLRALSGATQASVWRRISAATAALRRLGGAGTADAVAALVADLTGPVLAEGASVDPEVTGIAWRMAGSLGSDEEVVEASRRNVASPDGVHPELLTASLDVYAAHGGDAELDHLWDAHRNAATPQDERRHLNALVRIGEAAAFRRALDLCRTEVRTQDAPYQLALAMGHADHGATAWAFVAEHWDELVDRFPSNSIVRMAGGVTSFFDPETCDDVLAFFETHQIPQGATILAQHLELVRVHRALERRVAGHLVDALA